MTKKEIIDAAFRVWGRNFYRKTSLSQLARELGVSKPALYRHFENKQALTTAMAEHFMEDFADSIKADFDKALKAKDADEGISFIISSISDYFARNAYALIFSLINIYARNLDKNTIVQRLKERNVDLDALQIIIMKKYAGNPVLIRLIFATLTFFMSHYHKTRKTMETPLTEEEIKSITMNICKTIESGLGYSAGSIMHNFDELELLIKKMKLNAEPEPFFKAVAEAVAEAGPWEVSMEMVAKKIGLSKSSLYGHFKNKKDMLRRLFVTEFKRIIEFARQGINLSANTAEQLYLGIFSIAVYLRSRPEILIAMDWIRTRKLELGKPENQVEIFRLFEDVDIEPIKNSAEDEKQRISHWILFMLINILTIHPKKETQSDCIRVLYKFVTLGLGGFKK
ncbi:MAG: TetR/AcrR family transcriptional regulator [Treponema sp.]|nr:TetR/AcrR family transcriptional regulator [Treponema sp.]